MPFEKGRKKTGGKKQGTENKATKDIKEAYKLLIENNLENLSGWLQKIAVNNPEKAIYIIADLSEFVIPKLARQEHTGANGEAIKIDSFPDLSKLSDEERKEMARLSRKLRE
jgi:hypothetical protein